ncbi:MAG: MlaD family protein [Actinomycetota bacterium]|nr:MlaD family protein [Actinomycetota bacterium]
MRLLPRRNRDKKKTRRKSRLHPLAVAVIMIVATLFVVFYAFNGGLPFVHQYTMYAIVNNSVNVRMQSPMRIAGIDVGQVQTTAPDGDATKVTFTLQNNGLPIHTNATLTIRDRLFLEGGYYLQLNPGTPSAPLAHEGFTIPLQNTSTPVQFYKLLSTFDVAARASLAQVLSTLNQGFSPRPGRPLSDSGAGGLKQAIPQLTPALKDIAWITRALHGTQAGDVQRLLSSAADVTGTLNRESGRLTDLITGLNRTSSALVSTDGALAQSIVGLDRTLQVSPAALTAIDRSLPPLVNLSHALTPSLKVSPPILASITGTITQLNSIINPARRRPLLTALRATLTEFPSILTQLASAFPITKQVGECLRTHLVPLFNEQVPDGSLSTGRPVWQDFVHFLPNVAGATGSFDANGYYTRVLAGAGTNTLSGGLLGTVTTLVGTVTNLVGIDPGGAPLTGARPAWVGAPTPADFRPDVPCTSQTLPSLAAPAAAPDLASTHVAAAKPLSHKALVREIAQASGAPTRLSAHANGVGAQ